MKANFKDKLIENKWLTYQTKLSSSLRDGGYYNCPQYHCMRSAYQYHKLSDVTKKSDKDNKLIKLKYDHFKNRKLTKRSLIKEHLWYILKNEDCIVISGDYSTTICHEDTVFNTLDQKITKYYPNKPNSLKLNDIPVVYRNIRAK